MKTAEEWRTVILTNLGAGLSLIDDAEYIDVRQQLIDEVPNISLTLSLDTTDPSAIADTVSAATIDVVGREYLSPHAHANNQIVHRLIDLLAHARGCTQTEAFGELTRSLSLDPPI